MLILLPPSEGKAQRGRGHPLDLGRLSFPALTKARKQTVEGLVATSAQPDAVRRLTAPAGVVEEVRRNIEIQDLGTLPAERLYTGVLYDALDLASLEGPALRRARRWIVITSALFGAVRLTDPLPPYRLPICARVDGIGKLEPHWRPQLGPVLTKAAGGGVVLDCRSSSYVDIWRPTGDLTDRWVQVRVLGVSHWAKHTRGLVARHLCVAGSTARDVPGVAGEVGAAFDVELHEPARPGKPWVLDVHPPHPPAS